MAFCNSCGATLGAGAKFCNQCGAAVTGGVSAPVAPSPPAGRSSALKIVLIVIGVLAIVGILSVATMTFVGLRIAKRSHVSREGDQVKVETPFGTVESSQDPEKAASNLGVDIYPGAEVQKEGASSATFGGMHTAAASFESTDSLDRVCNYYKAKYPGAMVRTSDMNRCTIVANDQRNMITINVEARGDVTRFQITNVSKNTVSGSSH
jgi:zinc-ribbon domain